MRFQSKIIENEAFTPILLKDDFPISKPDRNLRGEVSPIGPHVHDCFELGYCYEGSGIFVIENKILPFQAGDIVVINHRELHVMQGGRETPAKWDFINLDPSGMLAKYVCEEEYLLNTEKFCGSDFINIISARKYPDICIVVREIMEELLCQHQGYRSLVRSLIWMLLIKLHRLVPDATGATGNNIYSRKKLALIQPALVYIVSNYSKNLSVENLAERCHASTANFRKLFHAAAGMSPMDYIKELRLKIASVMLTTTEKSISEIAISSGYPTLSNFNRLFKKSYGISPREYRLKR